MESCNLTCGRSVLRRVCRTAIGLIAASIFSTCLADNSNPPNVCLPIPISRDRGISVLASSIGSDYTPDGLAQFVRDGKFTTVIIDWAWITYHWNVTDLTQVNRFVDKMAAQNVKVAAMYRPRFLQNPTVATQVGQAWTTSRSATPTPRHGNGGSPGARRSSKSAPASKR